MSYGIEIYSNTGKLQISENFKNLALISKGTLNFSNNGGQYQATVKKVQGQFVAFRCNAKSIIANNGENWIVSSFNEKNVSIGGEYWVFGDPSQGQKYDNSNWGLEVIGTGGEICFDSHMKYMRVVDFVSKKLGDSDEQVFSSDGRTYAMAVTSTWYIQQAGSDPSGHYMQVISAWGAFQNAGSGVKYTTSNSGQNVDVASAMLPALPSDYEFSGIVIDVTNL